MNSELRCAAQMAARLSQTATSVARGAVWPSLGSRGYAGGLGPHFSPWRLRKVLQEVTGCPPDLLGWGSGRIPSFSTPHGVYQTLVPGLGPRAPQKPAASEPCTSPLWPSLPEDAPQTDNRKCCRTAAFRERPSWRLQVSSINAHFFTFCLEKYALAEDTRSRHEGRSLKAAVRHGSTQFFVQ